MSDGGRILLETRIDGLRELLRLAFRDKRRLLAQGNAEDAACMDARCAFLSRELGKARRELEARTSAPKDAFLPLFFNGDQQAKR